MMPWRMLWKTEALILALLTACAGSPRVRVAETDLYEAELDAIRYDMHVLTAGTVKSEPVRVSAEEFQKALRVLAREIHPSELRRETARWLLEAELQATVLAEVEDGRVARLVPLEEGSPLSAPSNAALVDWYQRLCMERYEGVDCLGLVADGSILDREDRRTLALAVAFGSVLQETGRALKQMVSPQAVLGLLVGMAMLYFTLWLVPEPVTKGLAALMTLAFISWLGVDTVWGLMKGWTQLVHEADRAITPRQLEEAGKKFARVMGENTARVVVLVVTAALGGGAVRFPQQLPRLPGFARAAAQAEVQGTRLSAASGVEAVAAPAEGTFHLTVRSPGSRAAAASDARAGLTTLIRHQRGNRQVFINGQRWHVPKNKSVRDIPNHDPVGDQLQAAAKQTASRWRPEDMSGPEIRAIQNARASGEHWKANLLEREARGRFVHREVARQFENLRWTPRGVDALDPKTGYQYELLTGTTSNMERHGRRMAEELFRMIDF